MKASVLFPLAAVCVMGHQPPGNAYTLGARWEDNVFEYYVNATSFVDEVNGTYISLSSSDWRWWIAYSASIWPMESGADVETRYLGSSTTDCETNDGVNTIGASAGCVYGDCETYGSNVGWTTRENANGYRAETDICLYGRGGESVWDIELGGLASRLDSVGTLIHEFGHALGLSHTANTVMNGGVLTYGRKRHLSGDDVQGMQAHYGISRLDERWSHYSASSESLGTEYSKPGEISQQPAGAVGRSSSSWYVLRAAQDADNDRVWIDHASYPLSSSSSWTGWYYSGGSSWIAPAITGTDATGDEEFVLATVPKTTYLTSCSGLKFYRSTTLYSSANYATPSDICTFQQPAVAYDPTSERYVLAYVRAGVGANISANNRIYARTSTTGTSWSSSTEVDTGLYSNGPVSLACDDSECVLGYSVGATDYPFAANTRLTVSGSTVSVGSTHTSGNFTRTAPVGTTSSGYFFQLMGWHSTIEKTSWLLFDLFTRRGTSAPITDTSWTSLSRTTQTIPGPASNTDRVNAYVFYGE